jgi:hypothetical protein
MNAFEEARDTLYRAAFGAFVAERKRLAEGLKAAGDKEGAARLAKLPRPSVSAWAVNQLWWHEREAFDGLLEAAARVKAGELEASKQHRDALGKLRGHATRLLRADGNAAAEGTLRRVLTTLSAVAAAGGFAPDPDGGLSADRDPPGFETLGMAGGSAFAAEPSVRAKPRDTQAEAAAERARVAEARRREEEERARRKAERERLSAALRQAQGLRDARAREIERLRGELEVAEQDLKQTKALLTDLEAKLAALATES